MPKPPEDAPLVTWEQTRAFRLQRQHVTDPLGPRSFLRIVRELGGVQAQVASAGEIQCALRAPGLKPGAITTALVTDRTLVKTWMMRGTIHLLAAEDLAVWASASTTRPTWNKGFWKKNFGVEEKDIQAASDIVESVMSAEGMTRDAIADAVFAKVKNQAIDELLRAGWGSFLKIIAARGQLCFGVPEGRNVTFVRPDMWVKDWQSIDTDAALREVCRRYLGSHGPATREEFARWWGFAPARANQVLEELTGETVIVNREGDAAYVLKKDLKKLESSREDDEIRNLGLFDAYVLSGLPHDQIIPKFHKDKVLTTGAWVQRTVLRGGRVVGVWTVETKGKARRVELKPFKKGDVSKSEFSAALAPFVPFVGELTLV